MKIDDRIDRLAKKQSAHKQLLRAGLVRLNVVEVDRVTKAEAQIMQNEIKELRRDLYIVLGAAAAMFIFAMWCMP